MTSGRPVIALSPSIRRDVRTVGLVGSAHFWSHFYGLVLPPLFPLIKTAFDLSYTELGLLLTVYAVASGILQTPVGFLVDRYGPRAILIAGLALISLAVGAMGMVDDYPGLAAAAALAGLGNSVFHPADYAIMSASIDHRRLGRAFSLHTFSGYAGWAAAPVAMALLASWIGWQGALVVAGAAGLATAAMLFACRRMLGIPAAVEMAAGSPVGGEARPAPVGHGAAVLISLPVMMCFLFYVFIAMSGAGLQAFAVTAFVGLHGTPFNWANGALTAYLIGAALGILVGGVVADRTRRHDRVAMAGLIAGAVVVLFAGQVALVPLVLIVVWGFAGALNGMIMPSRDLLVRSVTPPGATGKVYAFVSTGLDVGAAMTPVLFGWFMDRGDYRLLFVASASCLVLAAVTALVTRRTAAARPITAAGD